MAMPEVVATKFQVMPPRGGIRRRARVARAAGPVSSPALRGTLRIGGAAVAVYGLYALVKNQMVSYLLLQSSFVFFDFERPLPLFFTEYLAIMGLFVFLAHYGAWGVQRLTKKG